MNTSFFYNPLKTWCIIFKTSQSLLHFLCLITERHADGTGTEEGLRQWRWCWEVCQVHGRLWTIWIDLDWDLSWRKTPVALLCDEDFYFMLQCCLLVTGWLVQGVFGYACNNQLVCTLFRKPFIFKVRLTIFWTAWTTLFLFVFVCVHVCVCLFDSVMCEKWTNVRKQQQKFGEMLWRLTEFCHM